MVQGGRAITTKISAPFSIYLDLLRILAASVVVIGHYPVGTWQSDITSRYNLGYDAVVVFFVLSGYVISYAAAQIEKTWLNYVVNRAARILPVSTAAVLLSLFLMYFGQLYRPDLYPDVSQLHNIPYYFGLTVSLVNEFWWNDVRPFGNGPYWSLALEVWCYVIYGIALFVRGRQRFIWVTLALLATGPKQIIFLPVWLAGSFAYHLRDRFTLSRSALSLMCVGPVITYCAIQLNSQWDWSYPLAGQYIERWLGHGLDGAANFGWAYILAPLVAVHLFAVNRLGSMLHFLEHPVISNSIRRVASYTFSLYIFHYPLITFWKAMLNHNADGFDPFYRGLVYAGTIIPIIFLARILEHKKRYYRNLFIHLFTVAQRLVARWSKATSL